MSKSPPKRAHIEDDIQIAVFQHIAARGAPGLVAWHTPNGGARGLLEAKRLKAMGVRPGISDVLCWLRAKLYVLELKAPDGELSGDQLGVLDDFEREGAIVDVAYSLSEALATLETWGILRGVAR